MFLLQLFSSDGERKPIIGAFETMEEGEAFVSRIPTYERVEEDGFVYEYLQAGAWPDYFEVKCKGHIVPFSRMMFPEGGRVEIFWIEIPNLSAPGMGLVPGCTLVDAYSINNEELEAYIQARNQHAALVEDHLRKKGYEVSRAYAGSEDGEAILYRKTPTGEAEADDDWHFLTHMDPSFVDSSDILEDVDEILREEA